MEAHEYAMAVLDLMVREIRNAGYFPNGTACTNVSNTAGIVSTPTAQSFRLVYDTNGDGSCEEDVSFTYDSVNKNILRNGSALTDGNATDVQFIFYPQQTSARSSSLLLLNGKSSGLQRQSFIQFEQHSKDYDFRYRAVEKP